MWSQPLLYVLSGVQYLSCEGHIRIRPDLNWTNITAGCLRTFHNWCTEWYRMPVPWLYSSFTRLKPTMQYGQTCGDFLEGFPRAYISQSGSFPHTKQGWRKMCPAGHLRKRNG